jgi:DNA polymerase type B, organellar and viral
MIKLINKNIFIAIFLVIIISFHINYGTFNLDTIIISSSIISKKFNIKGELNKDRLYHNLYSFLNRLDDKFIKVMVKITIIDAASKKRLISLTKFIYVNTTAKYDIQSFINHALVKFHKYMDHYHPININGLFVDYLPINESNYLENSIKNPWGMKKVDLETFPFPLTVDYESLADKIVDNYLYVEYTNCKGFKDSKFASFRVTHMYENETTKISSVYLVINKEIYQFNDIFEKDTGIVERKFLDGTTISSANFKIEEISNPTKINLLKAKDNQELGNFKGLTLDCETYLDADLNQHLMSVAIFDGKNSNFYFIGDYYNEQELVSHLIKDLLQYNNCNIYIHNGAKFDLIFLFNKIASLQNEVGFDINIVFKDGELLDVNIHNDKNSISIKDSCKLLLAPLSKLAETFDISQSKGCFPFDFAKPENFNYIGITPDIKYYAFDNKPLISKEEYNSLVKTNWNFQEELKKYNILDCVVLYKVMNKFYSLILDTFGIDMKYNPTLSSLAFSIYRLKYIPDNLVIEKEEKNGSKKPVELISDIDSLNIDFDKVIRNSYFGGHVDAYIPHFDNYSPITDEVVYQYDVVSLYPYVMKTFDMPYKIKRHFIGNILHHVPELFNNSIGFYKVKVTSPTHLINPILPYRTEKGIVLYPLGNWTGIYLSEEIKNAMNYGYKFEVLEGYIFESTNLFENYIDDLFQIKLDSTKGTPMYTISKLLMNSLYGKFGIHQELPNYQVLSNETLSKLGLNTSFTEELALDGGYKLVNIDGDVTNPQSNVAIASAITAYARIHMSQYFNLPEQPCFYTDTDSLFTTNPLPENLVGKDLGQLALESKFTKFITLGPKFYGGITTEGQEVIKVKGLSKENLPSFKELEILLENGKTLTKQNKKAFKDLGLGTITLKNLEYLIKPTENKRDFVYFGNKIMYTKSKVIKESD